MSHWRSILGSERVFRCWGPGMGVQIVCIHNRMERLGAGALWRPTQNPLSPCLLRQSQVSGVREHINSWPLLSISHGGAMLPAPGRVVRFPSMYGCSLGHCHQDCGMTANVQTPPPPTTPTSPLESSHEDHLLLRKDPKSPL